MGPLLRKPAHTPRLQGRWRGPGRRIFRKTCLGVPGAPEGFRGQGPTLPAPSDPQGLALWRGHAHPAPHWTHPGTASAGRSRALPELAPGSRPRRNRNRPRTAGRWAWPREAWRALGDAESLPANRWRHGHRPTPRATRPGCGPERAEALFAPIQTRPEEPFMVPQDFSTLQVGKGLHISPLLQSPGPSLGSRHQPF